MDRFIQMFAPRFEGRRFPHLAMVFALLLVVAVVRQATLDHAAPPIAAGPDAGLVLGLRAAASVAADGGGIATSTTRTPAVVITPVPAGTAATLVGTSTGSTAPAATAPVGTAPVTTDPVTTDPAPAPSIPEIPGFPPFPSITFFGRN